MPNRDSRPTLTLELLADAIDDIRASLPAPKQPSRKAERIAELEGRVASLQGLVTGLSSQLARLENRIKWAIPPPPVTRKTEVEELREIVRNEAFKRDGDQWGR